jgi:clan AA aspartic protease
MIHGMGVFSVDIEIVNETDRILEDAGHGRTEGVRSAVVSALVDTGATVLVIPESLRVELGLNTVARQLVGIADGSVVECDEVGPVVVRFGDRSMIGTAIAIPGEANVLLGAVQMETMDLVVDPLARRLTPNPRSPERARLLAVGVRVFGPVQREP